MSLNQDQQLNTIYTKADGGIAKLGISFHGPRYRSNADVRISRSRSSFLTLLELESYVLDALHSEGPVSFIWNSQSLIDW